MTTTACDDQFAPEPVEPVRQPYDTAAILRRNVADMEVALRTQIERAEAAEAELLAVREDNHSMMLEIEGLRNELTKLREQAPALYMAFSECGQFIRYWTRDTANLDLDATMAVNDFTVLEFFARPTPAPAVPEYCKDCGKHWTDATAHANLCVAEMLRQDTKQAPAMAAVPAEWRSCLDSACSFLAAYYKKYGASPQQDEAIESILEQARALQSALQAPIVPEEWREVMAELAADVQAACDAEHPHREQYPSVMRKYNNDMEIVEKARALLQSADHSERNLEKASPDCRACANRGRINGLSQESYCDSCIYQGRDWRQNHFVDAVKRRCEACAILPCSCK